jgi:hypothetical protein
MTIVVVASSIWTTTVRAGTVDILEMPGALVAGGR